jgi:GGDEF domain-containing protein
LEPQVSRSRRYGNVLSVIIAQITNLDVIEKQIGEVQTCELIIACSHMLNDQVRWADMIGHINDHEFLLILPETSEPDTHKLKDILIERFAAVKVGDMAEKNISLEVDFGICQWQKGMDVAKFIETAREVLEERPQEKALA